MTIRRRLPALMVLLPALSSPARAQDTAEAAVTLEPVMVEARRWQEAAGSVPGSVTVLSGDRVDRPAWDSVEALRKVTPNVQVEESSVQTRVVLRGMTAANTGLQDPVGFFVNDVALPHGATQAPRLFDVDRMEVLKGPQGALYGRNTEAGAVKVETATPSWTPEARVSLTPSLLAADGARDGRAVGSARVSGAVVPDRLAVSMAARGETTDGLHRNLHDGTDDGGGTQRWTLSSGLTAFLGDDTDLTVKSVAERSDLGKQRMRYRTGRFATDRFETAYNTDAWDDTLTAVQSARLDHRFSGADLTAIAGWTRYDHDFRMDLDTGPLPTPATRMDHRDDAISLETRLASPGAADGFRWLAGLYAFQEWTDLDYSAGVPQVRRVTEIDQTGLAGFGQVEVALAERLRLEAGGRLEWISQSGSQRYAAMTGARTYGQDQTEVAILPRLALSYDLGTAAMTYLSLSRGYLPGGYNYAMATNAATLTYDPEYSWTAEAGIKGRVWRDRLGLSAAVFHTRTRDKQVIDLLPGGAQSIENAARAEVTGLELAADARLDRDWTLTATLGLQDAEFSDYMARTAVNGSMVPVDRSGNDLPMAANATYGLTLRYDPGGDGLFGEAGLAGSGAYAFDSDNALMQSAFTTVDAEVGYRLRNATVSLWGANLFDETLYSRSVATPNGIVVEDTRPREVGLRLTMQW